jgi:spermidine synthase
VKDSLYEATRVVRNFYGVLTVLKEDTGTKTEKLTLRHGRIRHGFQFTDPGKSRIPTCYYDTESGVGLAIRSLQSQPSLKIGVIGLGAGTMGAYGRSTDHMRFYEIDEDVIELSRKGIFTYVSDCPCQIEMIPGDGRISLERERANGPQGFDLLAIDAFNSDSIPAHLLTEEAMETYLHHLKPHGWMAFHISNRYLDLRPVVFALAQHFGMNALVIDSEGHGHVSYRSRWVLLGRNRIQAPELVNAASEEKIPGRLLWKDSYHGIFQILER